MHPLRRHLQDRLDHERLSRRGRRMLSKQLGLVGGPPEDGDGVREPRRPAPSRGPAAAR